MMLMLCAKISVGHIIARVNKDLLEMATPVQVNVNYTINQQISRVVILSTI